MPAADPVLGVHRRALDHSAIVVVNPDSYHAQETIVRLDMPALGLDWTDRFAVRDEVPQEIPSEVWEAYEELVGLGYDKYVIR